MAAMAIRVRAALRDSGFWKAGTPSEIASTPDRATAPDEKARRRTNSPSACPDCAAEDVVQIARCRAGAARGRRCTSGTSPYPIRAIMDRT